MDQKRLEAILEERRVNPTAFQRDGYKYFEEALPDIEALIHLLGNNPFERKVEIPKAPYVPAPDSPIKILKKKVRFT